ncbi:hypothetical protein AM365_07845 [Escherichia coli]|jgi:hypothetical protein|nr:hypothetical protein BE957_23635 [Escherichia coli]ARA16846.1 hypothetical protein AM365_07845 [Escherichia coli]ARW94145.1 hypothetical protein AM366_22485 [Escherichia coli]KSY16178.1 hypothetical protein APT99_20015 [Escherichia coli]ODH17629.1 hypothetical protein A6V28_09605 [Escherichia coli]
MELSFGLKCGKRIKFVMYALQKQSENEVVMSERYEFLPNCFLKVSISSGYFTAILDGSLPPDTPGSVHADNATQVIIVLDSYFQLTDLQHQGIANYLCSQGMEL